MIDLLIIKIIVSIAVTIGLSLLAEKVSTRFAGILLGYPLAAAIILFFIGIEQGTSFAAETSIWAINGLVAELTFAFFFCVGILYFNKYRVIGSTILGLFGFFVSAFLIRYLPLNSKLISVIFALLFIVLSLFAYRNVKSVQIKDPIKFSHKVLLVRALFATLVILAITGFAQILGQKWSGILTSFPINMSVILILIAYHYKKENVLTLIKNAPVGLISMVIFLLSISYTYPLYGVYWGIFFSYVMATAYLLTYEFLIKNYIKI